MTKKNSLLDITRKSLNDGVIEDSKRLNEFCKRYEKTPMYIQDLFKKLSQKYSEVVCK